MAFFKVRCTGNEDGSYTLSYGKGKGKLSALLTNAANGWEVRNSGDFNLGNWKLKRDAIAAWGAWAESAYGNGGDQPPAADSPVAAPTLSAPPKRQKSQAARDTGYEMRPHTPNVLYPYPDGFAVWRQVGYFKYESDARKAMAERTDYSGEGEPNAEIN